MGWDFPCRLADKTTPRAGATPARAFFRVVARSDLGQLLAERQ
jgi:hypothetical protein